ASGLPPGLTLAPGTNVISGTPTQPATYQPTVSVSDGVTTTTKMFTWVIQAAATEALTLANPGAQTNSAGDEVRLQLDSNAEDVEIKMWRRRHHHRNTRFSARNLPDGLYINDNGLISGRVDRDESGPHEVTVTLRDDGESVSQTFAWTILKKNRKPTLDEIHDQSSRLGASVRLQLDARDPDGDRLTFSATELPAGLTISNAGVISGTIGGSARTYHVTVTVSDGQVQDSERFDWEVLPRKNRAPSISELDERSSTEGATVQFTVRASDPDGDSLTFVSATGLPPGVTMSSAGVIRGTIAKGAAGDYKVRVTVSDGQLQDTETFEWEVAKPKGKGK
ncbi:MAG: putative Ig domain-containing protein, partial [Vicinamibacterales bacterium]